MALVDVSRSVVAEDDSRIDSMNVKGQEELIYLASRFVPGVHGIARVKGLSVFSWQREPQPAP